MHDHQGGKLPAILSTQLCGFARTECLFPCLEYHGDGYHAKNLRRMAELAEHQKSLWAK